MLLACEVCSGADPPPFVSPVDEKEMVTHLSLLIEIKEFRENECVHDGFGQSESFDQVKQMLYRILREFPLNGRAVDMRHDLRKTAMTLLSLFFTTVMNRDKELIREYIQT